MIVMKKIMMTLMVMLVLFSSNVYAFEGESLALNDNVSYEYFDDGSYIKTVTWCDENAQIQTGTRASDDYTVTGGRDVLYYDGDGNLDWKVTIVGVFLIVPSNVNLSGYCQEATLNHYIYDSSWHIYNKTATAITNNACGTCTMKRKFLGITTKTVDVDIYVTCDSYGNILK